MIQNGGPARARSAQFRCMECKTSGTLPPAPYPGIPKSGWVLPQRGVVTVALSHRTKMCAENQKNRPCMGLRGSSDGNRDHVGATHG